MEILFLYLMEQKGVSRSDILDYYVEDRGVSPQEYWFNQFGGDSPGDNMRTGEITF